MKRQHLIDRVRLLAELDVELQSAAREFSAAPTTRATAEASKRLLIAAVKLGIFTQRYLGGRS